jgi:hypothetical protein
MEDRAIVNQDYKLLFFDFAGPKHPSFIILLPFELIFHPILQVNLKRIIIVLKIL